MKHCVSSIIKASYFINISRPPIIIIFTLVLDGDHQLVGLINEEDRRCKDRIWPETT
jgi:hypothetical protein